MALADWTSDSVIVTTALSPDLDGGFYFRAVPAQFSVLAQAYLGIQFRSELAQISLPLIYRHKPLYNLPLYHELGHFVDIRHNISGLTLLLNPVSPPYTNIALSHRREHFADLFCACYMGDASTSFLVDFAGVQPASVTHPDTSSRIALVNDFLSNTANQVVNMFQAALTQLNLPRLTQRFSVPTIAEHLNNVCPPIIGADAELHGLLASGYSYLQRAVAHRTPPWDTMPEDRIESIVNDLAEKAIRNYMITTRWAQGAVP